MKRAIVLNNKHTEVYLGIIPKSYIKSEDSYMNISYIRLTLIMDTNGKLKQIFIEPGIMYLYKKTRSIIRRSTKNEQILIEFY